MKTLIKNDSIYSLNNLDNYNAILEVDIHDVVYNYISVIMDYLKHIKENLVPKNQELDLFVVIRGLDTLTHVFQFLLSSTNNLDISYYHTEKSFYYYVEFVTQISTDDKNFLQLSSRDATNYVYKKTIHEIKPEDKNIIYSQDTKNKLLHIQNFIDLNKLLYTHYITNRFLSDKDFKDLHEINDIQNKILNIGFDKNNLKIFSKLIDLMHDYISDFNHVNCVLKLLIKKINSNESIIERIKKNLEKINGFPNHEIGIFLNKDPNDLLKDIVN